MKNSLLVFVIIYSILFLSPAYSNAEKENEILRKSSLTESPYFVYQTSFPYPFNGKADKPAVSTGYYFVDSDDEANDYRPQPIIYDTLIEPSRWRRILQGPRLRPPSYWDTNTSEGLPFFRNPAMPAEADPPGNFFDPDTSIGTDSTDDAIAGPIPIGFDFYFNGIRFDSFYVSTNGIIALTNRRYFYDANGNRTIPSGKNTAYDPMSMDWFERKRTGNGLNDDTPDNFGYKYAVLGGQTGYGDLKSAAARGGIRNFTGNLTSFPHKAAVIAPFYGDMHLSQYNPDTGGSDDWGKVMYKRSKDNDKLIIYFVNIMPAGGAKATPYGNYTAVYNARPQTNPEKYISANAQVVIDRSDSSVTIVFEEFNGTVKIGSRYAGAEEIFRYNTTCGVRGFARHVNYGRGGVDESDENYPWAGEYEQATHYYSIYRMKDVPYPHDSLAVKFKQWKNLLRFVKMEYLVRSRNSNDNLEFKVTVPENNTGDYELLAGDDRLGALQPVAYVQNMSNNIQGPGGVNFREGQIRFRARLQIVNSVSNRIIYSKILDIDSACMAVDYDGGERCHQSPYVNIRYLGDSPDNEPQPFPSAEKLNGLPPYHYAKIYFPPFIPNKYVTNHIGRLKVLFSAVPNEPADNEPLGEEWLFDDSSKTTVYTMKRLNSFTDYANDFHVIDKSVIPSTQKWVNKGAEVVSGTDVSHYPQPPQYSFQSGGGFSDDPRTVTDYILEAPVIYMNRKDLNGNDNTPGDEIRSFPIDISNRHGIALSLSVQRNKKRDDWARGWCDSRLIGPEPRAVVNGNVFSEFKPSKSASYKPDMLVVEFAKPSPDGISGITNIPESNWRHHFRRGGAKPVTDMPVWGIYGGGGQLRGFLEYSIENTSAKDSALARPNAVTGALNGLRPNIYDDGMDDEYTKAFIAIPDTFINAPNGGAKNFRFRIRLDASNDQKCETCIPDDDDPFFVDNVRILFRQDVADLEISAIKVLWPYTQAPASQCSSIPIRVVVSNSTTLNAPIFRINTLMYKKGVPKNFWNHIYYLQNYLPFLTPLTSIEVPMPNWNARLLAPGEYSIESYLYYGWGGDLEPLNDTMSIEYTVRYGDDFAYDPVDNPVNNVPEFSGIVGRGLSLYGCSEGGSGNLGGYQSGWDDGCSYGYMYGGSGNSSGQIAMKFKLFTPDTIKGYRAYFGMLNGALDDIAFAIYADNGGLPGNEVDSSRVFKIRGYDDIRKDIYFSEYVTYLLPKPIVLQAGTYWAAITQLGETGLELGASSYNTGMRTINTYIQPPLDQNNRPLGANGNSLNLYDGFRKRARSGYLINDNCFAYENTRGSGEWRPFSPDSGNPAYAHLDHFGVSPVDNYTHTLSRGTWIPMLRPYLGFKSYDSTGSPYYWPVELTYFNGRAREKGIDLFWETASELNNYGFYIERKISGAGGNWETIDFVPGHGTSHKVINYKYFDDKGLVRNTVYRYRLLQVDLDGSKADGEYSNEIEIPFGGEIAVQNHPNPFSESTMITISVFHKTDLKIEVLDIFGKAVKTLADETVQPGDYSVNWFGDDESGAPVPSGTYICRIKAGDKLNTIKMQLIR